MREKNSKIVIYGGRSGPFGAYRQTPEKQAKNAIKARISRSYGLYSSLRTRPCRTFSKKFSLLKEIIYI
jgi:hypothetical protein